MLTVFAPPVIKSFVREVVEPFCVGVYHCLTPDIGRSASAAHYIISHCSSALRATHGRPCHTIRLLFSQFIFTRFISCPEISCSSRQRSGCCSLAKAVIPCVSFHSVAPPVTPSSGLLFISSFSTSRPSFFNKAPFCTRFFSSLSKSTSISDAP